MSGKGKSGNRTKKRNNSSSVKEPEDSSLALESASSLWAGINTRPNEQEEKEILAAMEADKIITSQLLTTATDEEHSSDLAHPKNDDCPSDAHRQMMLSKALEQETEDTRKHVEELSDRQDDEEEPEEEVDSVPDDIKYEDRKLPRKTKEEDENKLIVSSDLKQEDLLNTQLLKSRIAKLQESLKDPGMDKILDPLDTESRDLAVQTHFEDYLNSQLPQLPTKSQIITTHHSILIKYTQLITVSSEENSKKEDRYLYLITLYHQTHPKSVRKILTNKNKLSYLHLQNILQTLIPNNYGDEAFSLYVEGILIGRATHTQDHTELTIQALAKALTEMSHLLISLANHEKTLQSSTTVLQMVSNTMSSEINKIKQDMEILKINSSVKASSRGLHIPVPGNSPESLSSGSLPGSSSLSSMRSISGAHASPKSQEDSPHETPESPEKSPVKPVLVKLTNKPQTKTKTIKIVQWGMLKLPSGVPEENKEVLFHQINKGHSDEDFFFYRQFCKLDDKTKLVLMKYNLEEVTACFTVTGKYLIDRDMLIRLNSSYKPASHNPVKIFEEQVTFYD